MLVTAKEILDRANAEGYAVIAPNISCELDGRAAVEAAEELRTPIILDVGFASSVDIFTFGRLMREICISSSVPCAIQQDHGAEFAHAIHAIRAGFTSIMVDRSSLPYDENVAQVKELVKIAHAVGVSVESEIGHVGRGASYADDRDAGLSTVEEVVRFIADTGIDACAVAIGTAHGAYIGTPSIDYDRLVAIKEATKFPLVLHGSSNTGDERIKKCCELGINKVNVSNELCAAASKALQAADLKGNGAYGYLGIAKQGYKARLMELMHLGGSIGKAWIPELKNTPGAKTSMAE